MSDLTNLTQPHDGLWICDFCHKTSLEEMWMYPCDDLVIQVPGLTLPIVVTASNHGACFECHKLIESDDYLRLIDQCIQGTLELSDPDFRTKVMESYCNQFRAKRDPSPGTPVARY